jgi:hypothetical protein
MPNKLQHTPIQRFDEVNRAFRRVRIFVHLPELFALIACYGFLTDASLFWAGSPPCQHINVAVKFRFFPGTRE